MRKLRLLTLLLLLLSLAAAGQEPPLTDHELQYDTYHGVTIYDPFRWLENAESPATQAWVQKQNQYTQTYLADSDRTSLLARLTALENRPRTESAFQKGEQLFYFHNTGLQNQSVLYREVAGQKKVALDPNVLSTSGTSAVSELEVSPDGKYLAYSVSVDGSDWQEIRVRDLSTGSDTPDRLSWVKFTPIAWTPDNSGFFYTRYPAPGTVHQGDRTHFQKVYLHRLGQAQSADQLVFSDDEQKHLGYSAKVSHDRKHLLLSVWDGTDPKTGLYRATLAPNGEVGLWEQLVPQGLARVDYVTTLNGKLVVVTDYEASNGRLAMIDPEAPDPRDWQTFVGEQLQALEMARRVGDHIVVALLDNASHQVQIYQLEGRVVGQLELPTVGTVLSLNGEPESNELYFDFESFLYPRTVMTTTLPQLEVQPFQQSKMDFPFHLYETKVEFARSRDGTRLPVFVTARKGLNKIGSAPAWLYGYGGFNINMTPRFSVARLVWLEQGGVYAQAVLRGGSEYGENWHRAGMMEKKQNVFDDFIGAAEMLIDQKYTSSKKLVINGRSNGGLLVAACMTQRPGLFGAVVCQVPVIDMIRYHLFTVGRYWVPEYGSASEAKEFFNLLSYSPLHNVKVNTVYPPTLITTADTDDRVVPAHAKKFAATLQQAEARPSPVLLRVETKAGHGAGKPTNKRLEEWADILAFMTKALK